MKIYNLALPNYFRIQANVSICKVTIIDAIDRNSKT